MAVIASTGWAAAQASAFATAFRHGCIDIYDGPPPASADLPASGVLIARITANGGAWTPGSPTNGLRYVAADRYAIKDSQQSWTLVGLAEGTARSFRIRANAPDDGLPSTTAMRVDGAVGLVDDMGTTDAQLFLPTTSITPATTIPLTNWWYAVPPLGA